MTAPALTITCARCGQDSSRGVCKCTREWDMPRCPWCGVAEALCPDWDGHDRLNRGSELTWWRHSSSSGGAR